MQIYLSYMFAAHVFFRPLKLEFQICKIYTPSNRIHRLYECEQTKKKKKNMNLETDKSFQSISGDENI